MRILACRPWGTRHTHCPSEAKGRVVLAAYVSVDAARTQATLTGARWRAFLKFVNFAPTQIRGALELLSKRSRFSAQPPDIARVRAVVPARMRRR